MDYYFLGLNLLLLIANVYLFRRKLLGWRVESEGAAVREDASVADASKLEGLEERLERLAQHAESDHFRIEVMNERLDAQQQAAAKAAESAAIAMTMPSEKIDPRHQLQVGLISIVKSMSADLESGLQDLSSPSEVHIPSPFSVLDHNIWVEAVKLWRDHGVPLIADLPDRNCPACEGSQHRLIFDSYDGFPFHICDSCGAWFVPKKVDSDLYEQYFQKCSAGAEVADRIIRQRTTAGREDTDKGRIGGYLQELLPFVDECATAGRSYLDVGCGIAYSLQVAEELGFRAHGIEVDVASVDIARAKGLSVSLPGAELPDEKYSLISLWETIEHLASPQTVLKSALLSLAEGGVLALTFPNLNCPAVRLLRSECVYVHGGVTTPGHINLFELKSIERLLDSLGMCVIDADSQFGSNLQELVLYATGQHRGAVEFFNGSDRNYSMSKRAIELNNLVGPPLSLVERTLLMAPILQVFACRKQDKPRFEAVVQKARRRRATEILAQADSMMPAGSPEAVNSPRP